MSGKGTSMWRVAGLSYLQYVNKSAAVLRESLKEPVKSKLVARSNVNFAGFKWADGERGKRVQIDSIAKAAEAFAKA
ncbi:hypothetical protein Gpo141_00000180 [Globisporangium polare]